MEILLSRPSAKPILLAVSIAGISGLHYLTNPSHVVMHEIYQHLYYLPVILGAYWYGVPGGAITGVGTSVAYVPHILSTWSHDVRFAADQYAEIVVFFFLGLTVGLLSSAQQKLTARYRETAASLERSHRELLDSQEHLRHAERLSVLGQVAAGLAHEIRNPLAGLKGALDIIASRVAAGTPDAEFAGIAARDVARLDGLVHDFLTYARPRDPEMREVDLRTVVDHVVTVSGSAADQQGVRLENVPSALPIVVSVDREQMTQVLLNVVLNAVQATRRGGMVRLRTGTDTDWAMVDVSDEGPGIASEHQSRVFEPFFTTRKRGTGLGLAISYRIVAAHHGSIQIASSSSTGTTFRVRLPLAGHPAPRRSSPISAGVS